MHSKECGALKRMFGTPTKIVMHSKKCDAIKNIALKPTGCDALRRM